MGKIFQTYIDLDVALCYSPTNLIHQTVEAEITAMMPLQRAWIGGSQVRNTLSNGPMRAQLKVDRPEIIWCVC